MNKNILVSEVPGGCTVGISSPRTTCLMYFPLIPYVWKIEKWQTTSEVSKTLLFVE